MIPAIKECNLRVLLIAEQANPEWASVPLVGWAHAQAIARLVSAHLVTQLRNEPAIQRTGLDPASYTIINSERVAAPLARLGSLLRGGRGKGWTTVTAFNTLSYYYFERLVWKQFGQAIRRGDFDVVHRLTPLSPTTPSLMARKCRKAGVPFVLGPLNGGVAWPKAFSSVRRQEREWLSYVRSAYKLLPGYQSTRKNAAAIIIGSQDTWNQLPAQFHDKSVYIPENAVDPERFSRYRTKSASVPIRVTFVGRLVPYKGADMLLEAAAPMLQAGLLSLEIIGDGPQMNELRQFVQRESIEKAVVFSGWVPHTEVQNHLVDADLFVFPSIREFGGVVALEAMAIGLVPMVMRYGGLGELVTDQTGFLIEMSDRATIVCRLRKALQKLVDHPELIDQKSLPARQRALEHFTWHAKAQQVLEVYKWVLGRRSDVPRWGMPFP